MDEARALREYWFGPLPLTAAGFQERLQLWFGSDDAEQRRRRDQEIRTRFGALLEQAAEGQLESWAHGPRRRLSLVILLDQFPRNMFRGTARAFAYDDRALALSLSGMQSGADAALQAVERIFFYMPLQHAESRAVQEESVAAYRRLLAEAPPELRAGFAGVLTYAERHRAVIERFGRFPHRNRLLGRASTPAEEQWLQGGGESFS
ncbi:MAG TPA: DUF924 family protein [Steroidobacteraceae bacterium]|nr:DUF924 family protein [Steroidobacteraceae bacterium]